MPYKLTDDEVETVVQDWLADWHEPISAEEISTEPPTDAPTEPVREGQSTHDSDGESSTDTDPEAECTLEEGQTKRRMEFDTGSSTRVVLEFQLQ